MEKSIEKVLQAAIDTGGRDHRSSANQICKSTSMTRQEVMEAVHYLSAHELVTNESNGYFVIVTPDGLQYFNHKKSARHIWIAEHWVAPFTTGFLSGVLVALVGRALVMWLLHQ